MAPAVLVDEPLTITRIHKIEWSAPRVNHKKLTLLRFTHGNTERELAKHFGRSKTCIHQTIDRMVKDEFKEANLTSEEREKIK